MAGVAPTLAPLSSLQHLLPRSSLRFSRQVHLVLSFLHTRSHLHGTGTHHWEGRRFQVCGMGRGTNNDMPCEVNHEPSRAEMQEPVHRYSGPRYGKLIARLMSGRCDSC